MRRRRQVGIAHAKVDDVLAPRSRRCPHRVHFGDDIRWQASNTVKFLGHLKTDPLRCTPACRTLRLIAVTARTGECRERTDARICRGSVHRPPDLAAMDRDTRTCATTDNESLG